MTTEEGLCEEFIETGSCDHTDREHDAMQEPPVTADHAPEGLSTLDAGRLAEIREKAVQGRVVVDDEELLALLDLAAHRPPPRPHPTAGKDRDDMSETEELRARMEALAGQFDAAGTRGAAYFGADVGDTIRLWIERDPRAPAPAGDSGGERG